MAGKYDRYWEMRQGGPYDEGREVFKCTDCGAVTPAAKGHNNAPDPTRCSDKCKESHGDWKPGSVSARYKQNLAAMFPDSPGADL